MSWGSTLLRILIAISPILAICIGIYYLGLRVDGKIGKGDKKEKFENYQINDKDYSKEVLTKEEREQAMNKVMNPIKREAMEYGRNSDGFIDEGKSVDRYLENLNTMTSGNYIFGISKASHLSNFSDEIRVINDYKLTEQERLVSEENAFPDY